MPLTPADIHHVSFRKPPIGRRGYDQEDVDAFLDEIEQEMIRLLEENGALHQRVQGGDVRPATPDGLDDTVARLERMRELRARAEDDVRTLRGELEHAHRAATPAPASPDGDGRVLHLARRTADDHVRDAREEAEAVLSSARAEAGDIAGEARLRADVIEGDARRGHAEAMRDLTTERDAMLDEIDRLGRLARGYREAMATHIDGRLKDLDG